ncbi:unnamed protein product [Meloidogyne enterolobii]|uniref:Uncharacterized protein n=2 Tax=Meloidogyne enterolobii TaxID=390850 RepID=A0A6V7YCE5_MELEN|nr:unnamed protein product [Meloidogyne enterolobii]
MRTRERIGIVLGCSIGRPCSFGGAAGSGISFTAIAGGCCCLSSIAGVGT